MRRLALAVLVLLAGCSTVRLSYNSLDWLAAWEVDKYVDLNRGQDKLFDTQFDELWRWHRQTQMPRYAAALRGLSAEPLPVSTQRVGEISERATALSRDLVAELALRAAPIYVTLDDPQVRQIVDRLARDEHKDRNDLVRASREQRDRDAAERMVDQIEDWVGDLTDAQAARVGQWARAKEDLTRAWIDNRRRWRLRFWDLLDQRDAPDFAPRLRAQFVEGPQHWPDDLKRGAEINRGHFQQLLADLSGTLTPRQEQHLRQRLRDWAKDIEGLSVTQTVGAGGAFR